MDRCKFLNRARDVLVTVLGAAVLLSTVASPALAANSGCVGDCNNTGSVVVIDLIEGIRIALGLDDIAVCPAFDANGDSTVSIDELLIGVNNELNGCR